MPDVEQTNSRLRKIIISWGRNNIREYPWRYVSDPYQVLISEFMLHRTRAEQVIPVFEEFTTRWPTLPELLAANENDVREVMASLGLNWRIDGMLNAMQDIGEKYGRIPENYNDLIEIDNIGPYIASATICFSRNEPLPLVDTNVVRVIGRIFGLDLRGEARRRKEMISKISEVTDPEEPRDFYYAIIDLAHDICHPKNPECINCPLLHAPCNFGQTIIEEHNDFS